MPFMPSLGSAEVEGMKRSGCSRSALAPIPAGSPTPMSPRSIPQRSISRERHADRIVRIPVRLLRDVLEHVLDRELRSLPSTRVSFVCRVMKSVDLFHVGVREPDHGVHDPDVLRHTHARTLKSESGFGNSPDPVGRLPPDCSVRRRRQFRGTSRQGAPCQGSGSRGRPSTRSPRMFLFTSVVPPSIVLARLRSIPRTS